MVQLHSAGIISEKPKTHGDTTIQIPIANSTQKTCFIFSICTKPRPFVPQGTCYPYNYMISNLSGLAKMRMGLIPLEIGRPMWLPPCLRQADL